ncbi:MAG TPA: TetR/AcrR family transcriptional regulator [Egibacteraceae bacterium]
MPSIWAETLEEHRALVLGRLLDAFAELLQERGLEAITIAAVAERAGIARSAVYNHVGDKHDLLVAHAERLLRRATEDLRRRLPPELPARERLRRYVAFTFTALGDEPLVGEELMGLLDGPQQERLRAHVRPLHDILGEVIRDGLADGTFRGGSAEDLTTFVSATLAGYHGPLTRGELDPDTAAAVCTDLLLDGLTGGA